jgi:hypothetical protein
VLRFLLGMKTRPAPQTAGQSKENAGILTNP